MEHASKAQNVLAMIIHMESMVQIFGMLLDTRVGEQMSFVALLWRG